MSVTWLNLRVKTIVLQFEHKMTENWGKLNSQLCNFIAPGIASEDIPSWENVFLSWGTRYLKKLHGDDLFDIGVCTRVSSVEERKIRFFFRNIWKCHWNIHLNPTKTIWRLIVINVSDFNWLNLPGQRYTFGVPVVHVFYRYLFHVQNHVFYHNGNHAEYVLLFFVLEASWKCILPYSFILKYLVFCLKSWID